MYASQKFQVFPTFLRPEAHFRHAQGHQRARALTGSIITVQNKNTTVYEVESRKKFTENFQNGPIGFQK